MPLLPSLAVRVMEYEPTSSLSGVPENVTVEVLKESHEGSSDRPSWTAE